MKKVLKSLLLVFVVVSFSLSSFFATPVYAADGCSMVFTGSGGIYPETVTVASSNVTIDGNSDSTYLEIEGETDQSGINNSVIFELGNSVKQNSSFGPINITEKLKEELSQLPFIQNKTHRVFISLYSRTGLSTYKICQGEMTYSTEAPLTGDPTCRLSGIVCKDKNNQFRVSFSGTYENFTPNSEYYVKDSRNFLQQANAIPFTTSSLGKGSFQVGQFTGKSIYDESYTEQYCITHMLRESQPCAFSIGERDTCRAELAFNQNVPSCDDVAEFPEVPDLDRENPPFYLCQQAGPEQMVEGSDCMECLEKEGIWTAVGCIPYKNTTGMIRAFITLGLGIGGGVVVLMILAGSFVLSTSQGDPKRVEEAKAMISSAVMGLVFVIFSITILRFIGVSILQLPGFGS